MSNCIRCFDAIVGDGTEDGDGWTCADCRAELRDDEEAPPPAPSAPKEGEEAEKPLSQQVPVQETPEMPYWEWQYRNNHRGWYKHYHEMLETCGAEISALKARNAELEEKALTRERRIVEVNGFLHDATQENKRLKWQLSQFKVQGTDGCASCYMGRVTLFIANEKCIKCDPASYEVPAALQPAKAERGSDE